MKGIFIITFLSVFLSGLANAAGSGTGDQNVVAIELTSSNNLKITLENENHSSACATSGRETQMVVPGSDANFDHFLSIALSAQATGKKVYMWLDNDSCVSENSANFPSPMTIIIRNY